MRQREQIGLQTRHAAINIKLQNEAGALRLMGLDPEPSINLPGGFAGDGEAEPTAAGRPCSSIGPGSASEALEDRLAHMLRHAGTIALDGDG
jgi:hypothetical protein